MSIYNNNGKRSSDAVRIHIFWGEALLDVVELSPPRPFFIGDAAESKLPVDLTIPGVSGARVPLVTIAGGMPRVEVPFGASAVRRSNGARHRNGGELVRRREHEQT